MQINKLSITSQSSIEFEVDHLTNINFFCGCFSDLTLDLIRELIGDYGLKNDPDGIDDGRFIIHSDIIIDNKKYSVCYIRNFDTIGESRIGVNFEENSIYPSLSDTTEFIDHRKQIGAIFSNNVFEYCNNNKIAAESDKVLAQFYRFIDDIQRQDDKRPIFIYDLFERIDESTAISSLIDMLKNTGRQVFIAIGEGYLANKLLREDISYINTEYHIR